MQALMLFTGYSEYIKQRRANLKAERVAGYSKIRQYATGQLCRCVV